MKFSANLGFLWNDRSLPEAVRAAKAAGFDAVEVHWPYETPAADLLAALSETGLPILGLNTRRGSVEAGEAGLSALPGREDEARAAIDEAAAYARAVGAGAVHVMAGVTDDAGARDTFLANLAHAADVVGRDRIVLVEPLNRYDAPGYFLTTTVQAMALLDELGLPNVKLMFDCYHVQIMEGDLTRRLASCLPRIGHIQFASVPDRGPPDGGEIAYGHIFRTIRDLGWDRPLGAEYKPNGPTGDSLGWLEPYR